MNISGFGDKLVNDYNYKTTSKSKVEQKYNLSAFNEEQEMSEADIINSFYNLCKEYPNVNFRLVDTFDGEQGALNGQSYDVGNIMSFEGVNIQIDSASIIAMNQSEKNLKNMHGIINEAINHWSDYKNLGMDKESLNLPYATVDISFGNGNYELAVTHSQGDAESGTEGIVKKETLNQLLVKVNNVQNDLQDQYMQMVSKSLVQKEKLNN